MKGQYPDNQVKVTVDTAKLGLKVSRRPPKYPTWKDFSPLIPLPPEVYDVTARSVPSGFKVTGLPEPDTSSMETGSSDPPHSASPRQSRQDAFNASKASPPKKK